MIHHENIQLFHEKCSVMLKILQISAEALPQNPLGELIMLPDPIQLGKDPTPLERCGVSFSVNRSLVTKFLHVATEVRCL